MLSGAVGEEGGEKRCSKKKLKYFVQLSYQKKRKTMTRTRFAV
jgi:hypothetical protein